MVIITKDIAVALSSYLSSNTYDKIYILTDTNTRRLCLPALACVEALGEAIHITVEAGDMHKSIEQVTKVWMELSQSGASRHSLLINLGGGMVTDLGGFAGATFKRGLHTLNVPTTLMAAVDAAVGGKTGFNFNGLKNEIGSFYPPDGVLIDCSFFRTLDRDNILSGFAEMIKHGLISNEEHWRNILSFDMERREPDMTRISDIVEKSVAIKERIVRDDPKEQGLRKALNFGHTVGHALESFSFEKKRPVLHGHAVAAGIVCELYLSYKYCEMPVDILRHTTNLIRDAYPPIAFGCGDYDFLYERMTHDKKNENGRVRLTLLGGIGDVRINQETDGKRIFESLDFYRENMGM